MYGVEEPLARAAVEQTAQQLEACVRVAQSVSVREKEHLVVYLRRQRLRMYDESAFLLKVAVCPYVVVACEEVHLHANIRKLRELAEEPCVAFRNHVSVFVPEVEYVAEQVYRGSLMLYAVEKSHQPPFLCAPVFYGE
jgi:hypothetical protein